MSGHKSVVVSSEGVSESMSEGTSGGLSGSMSDFFSGGFSGGVSKGVSSRISGVAPSKSVDDVPLLKESSMKSGHRRESLLELPSPGDPPVLYH